MSSQKVEVAEAYRTQIIHRTCNVFIAARGTCSSLRVVFLLPPANEVWGKIIFSQVSVVLFTGGACVPGVCVWLGACMPGGVHAWGCACLGVHGRGACVVGGVHSQGGGSVRGRKDGHCSGRYASYWNTFLFVYDFSTAVNLMLITLLFKYLTEIFYV